MNTYAVDQFRPAHTITRNGHCRVVPSEWVEVLTLEASGRNSALRQADAKWPAFAGKHRARMIQTVIRPPVLCADDRQFIQRLTTQTI